LFFSCPDVKSQSCFYFRTRALIADNSSILNSGDFRNTLRASCVNTPA
jgi:hypothetical protein